MSVFLIWRIEQILLFWTAATAYALTRRRGLRRTAYAALLPAVLFVFMGII